MDYSLIGIRKIWVFSKQSSIVDERVKVRIFKQRNKRIVKLKKKKLQQRIKGVVKFEKKFRSILLLLADCPNTYTQIVFYKVSRCGTQPIFFR